MLLEEKTMIQNIKKSVWESFIASFLIILFAIVLYLNPENFISVAINIFGYGAIFIGVLDIVFYFRFPKEQRVLNHKLKNGLLLIACGIVAFFENTLLKEMTTVLLGGYLLFQNASRFELSFQLQNYTQKLWLYLLGISSINIILSLFIIINPFNEVIQINTYISILLIVTEILVMLQGVLILIGVHSSENKES